MDHQNRAAEAEQSFEKTERAWEETQGEVDQVMGSRIGPKENGTKEAWVARNKELNRGSGLEVDLYETRAAGDVTKVEWIGNLSGIDREWQQLLNRESGSYAGAERRRDKRDSNWRLYRVEAGQCATDYARQMVWRGSHFSVGHKVLNIVTYVTGAYW